MADGHLSDYGLNRARWTPSEPDGVDGIRHWPFNASGYGGDGEALCKAIQMCGDQADETGELVAYIENQLIRI